ncbi:hypothetical protein F4212_06480 [Candidatus Poribacteria bacterium]|nr:hypothetical protein [Candidatus Poribacteria bacterium]
MSWFSELFHGKVDQYMLKKAYKWGEGRAKTKLITFCFFQGQHPYIPKKELYYLTIEESTIFDKDTARQIVDTAANNAEGIRGVVKLRSQKQPFSLRTVVKHLLLYEETHHFGFNGHPHPHGMAHAFIAVDDIIPEDL